MRPPAPLPALHRALQPSHLRDSPQRLAHLFPPQSTRARSLTMSKDQLYLAGERSTGLDVRTQNVTAALSVANVVKSSLGPVGLDKMLVDDVGEVTITLP